VGQPSNWNHVFSAYYDNTDNNVIIIQVFLDRNVKLPKRMQPTNFLMDLQLLRTNNAKDAYLRLFGVEIKTFHIDVIWTARVT
jgi:hypothetical protein